ncbi:MAG: hypothetical protein AABZ62_01270 [Planctomycetota bacterium]
MSQGGLDKKTLVPVLCIFLLFAAQNGQAQAVEESGRELFERVCTMCHGWAVENFFVAEGQADVIPPICPPPTDHWLPIVLTVATYQVYAKGEEIGFPLIPRKDVLRLAEYLNENYPKEPICAGRRD